MVIRTFAMILLMTFVNVFSQNAEQSAKLSQLVGSVEVRSGESAAWRKARVGMPIRANWDIRTYLESSAEVTLESGTVIKIGENTVISLSKLNKDTDNSTMQSNVKVLSGQMWANVKKMTNSKSEFDFETPTAVASIRGTRLGIEVNKEKSSIDVYEGLVMVRKRNSSTSIAVKPNFRAVVESNKNDVSVIEFKDIKKNDSTSVSTFIDPFSTGITDSTLKDTSVIDTTVKEDSLITDTSVVNDSTVIDTSIVKDTSVIDTSSANDTSKTDTSKAITSITDTLSSSGKVSDTSGIKTVADTNLAKAVVTDTSFAKVPIKDTAITKPLIEDTAIAKPSIKDTVIVKPLIKDTIASKASQPTPTQAKPAQNTNTQKLPTDEIIKTENKSQPLTNTLNKAPSLQISSPVSGAIVQETPQILRGKTSPGAILKINNRSVDIGSDGSFAEMIELNRGSNMISVTSTLTGIPTSQQIKIEYRPKLELTVGNIENNMEVTSKNLQLDINVSENAKFSTNGKEGEVNVTLSEGRNLIIVEAWNEWNTRTVQQFQVYYKTVDKFNLKIISPSDGIHLKEPFIQVTGSTTAGAKVYVNGVVIQVGTDGFFSYRMPIPDEPQEYTLEIGAELAGNELSEERVVIYEPEREKLILEVTSPQSGQRIDRKSIRISGKTLPQSQVTVNGIPAPVLVNGTFAIDYMIQESDIGDYTLEIITRNQDQELSKIMNVVINGTSNQINTSVPQCIVTARNLIATRVNTMPIQSLDRTPDDQLILTIQNNGITEQIQTGSGKSEQLRFQEGKNSFSISVRDMAGNMSNVVNGNIYYLPGPISLSFIEPSSTPYIIRGVPPMPGKGGLKPAIIQVEIEDNIGSVPETIKYCKLIGNNQSILLRNNNDYIFKGEAVIVRGRNYFTIQTEDIAGNNITTKLEIIIE